MYLPSDYDSHDCLKPPLLLWIAVLYLSRAITLPLFIGLGHFTGVDSGALAAMRGLWSAEALFPSLFAGMVLCVLVRRVPAATRLERWIWSRGAIFLATSAATDLALSLVSIVHPRHLYDQPPPFIYAAVDVYFLLYVVAARRVRDAFSEFPPAESSGA
jgi:hypothetical protein